MKITETRVRNILALSAAGVHKALLPDEKVELCRAWLVQHERPKADEAMPAPEPAAPTAAPPALPELAHAIIILPARGDTVDVFWPRDLGYDDLVMAQELIAANLGRWIKARAPANASGVAGIPAPSRDDLVKLLDEVRQCFTRDDDLPGDLLSRIDLATDGVGMLRAPLTDEQIAALVPSVQAGWTREQYCQWMGRAVERAHGIGDPGMASCPHGVPHRWPCEQCDTSGVKGSS